MSIFPNSFFDQQRFNFNFFDPFQGFFSNGSTTGSTEVNAEIDWRETKDAHIFKIDLPGLTREDVKLQVLEGVVLQVSGERREEEEEEVDKKGEKWHCKERTRGKFSRRFRLPENGKVDEIKAEMENGVLTVTLPKDEKVKKKLKKHKARVEISGGDHDEDGDGSNVNSKGIGRFVCCRA